METAFINDVCSASQEDTLIGAVDHKFSSQKDDLDIAVSVTQSVFTGCNHRCAGSGPAGERFAVAAFPDPHAERVSVHDAHKFGIDQLGEYFRVFKLRPDGFEIQPVDLVAEYYTVWVPDIDASDPPGLTCDNDRSVDYGVAFE